MLGGRKVKVGLVDANANGIYGERALGEEEGDLLLVDFDGDGEYRGSGDDGTMTWDTEAFPINRLMQMPDGNFYHVKAEKDGSRLWLERDTAPLGSIKIACARVGLDLVGEDGPLWVRATRGEV